MKLAMMLITMATTLTVACGSSDTSNNGGGAEVPTAPLLQAGLWEIRSRRTESLTAAGAEEAGKEIAETICVTPELLARPADVFASPRISGQCEDSIDARDGRVRGKRSCTYPDDPITGDTQETFEGTYSGQAYSIARVHVARVDAVDSKGTPQKLVLSTDKILVTARRLGDCPASSSTANSAATDLAVTGVALNGNSSN